MPSIVPPLAQSESKKRFFERLSLDEHDPQHKRIYSLMKQEAIAGRSRIADDPNSLIPSLRNDPTVEPPYSNNQICEDATHREILRIYALARPETRFYYDKGRDTDRLVEENWVIRWMLWHVNRYRDHRNKNRANPRTGANDSTRPEVQSSESPRPSSSARLTQTQEETPRSQYWDPVRDS